MDREIVDITAKIRTNPKWLIPILEDRISKFKGKILSRPGKINTRTLEGPKAV